MKPPIKRCAIYTRKSSEEGLEQEFNSLDAQYESCLAYITSQKADPESAPLVQMLFERYHALGCVSALKRELDRNGITSRKWSSSTGLQHGGASFSRGILYKILRNPVYIGQIKYRHLT